MNKRKSLRNMMWAYIFILPSFVLLVIFHLIPIWMTFRYSLSSYNVIQAPIYIGAENYRKLWEDPFVISSLWNTGIYTLIVVPMQTILSMLIAYLLSRKFNNKLGNFVRSAMFIPVITSMILTSAVWRLLLSGNAEGVVNSVIGFFGIAPVNWLGKSWPALIAVCIIAVWKNTGYFLCRDDGYPRFSL